MKADKGNGFVVIDRISDYGDIKSVQEFSLTIKTPMARKYLNSSSKESNANYTNNYSTSGRYDTEVINSAPIFFSILCVSSRARSRRACGGDDNFR